MDVIVVALALVVAVFGGWPVTAGILKLAKSNTVRAVDTAELQEPPAPHSNAPEVSGVAVPVAPDPRPDAAVPDAPVPDAPVPDAAAPGAPAPNPSAQVLRGGLLIGFLERAAVAVAILTGQPIAIAYVVAIKGLGRYPELKDTPAASERFIIGTLASMLWAASVAVLTRSFLDIG